MSKVRMRKNFLLLTFYFLLVFISGCSKEKSPTETSGTHAAEWMDLNSNDFHGRKVINVGTEYCKTCHGDDFNGGKSKISCYDCHTYPHPSGWSHNEYIKENGYILSTCQACHGNDYSGGRSESSCNTCHSETPEACNTCHGSSNNSAPPKDIDDHTATAFRGVGAHQSHLTYSQSRFNCSECHIKPASINDSGHIDSGLPAEITWGNLAKTGGLNPDWNGSTCSDVYCHGASLSGGSHTAPVWTIVDGTEAACGTCHGIPPHGDWGSCNFCHSSVVGPDTTIIDKDVHINGTVDF